MVADSREQWAPKWLVFLDSQNNDLLISSKIEVVPFFHQMAFSIIKCIGRDGTDSKDRIRATVIAAFSISTILTGVVFLSLGRFRLGSLVGFFPSHILIGCIGGVGLFLVRTGFEVSARLPGNMSLNLVTLQTLIQAETLPLWIIPLLLAFLLIAIKHRISDSRIDAGYFIFIIAVFWYFVTAIPEVKVPKLRQTGWIFKEIEADKPWYHFYTLYSAKYTDWNALGRCIPAMLACKVSPAYLPLSVICPFLSYRPIIQA